MTTVSVAAPRTWRQTNPLAVWALRAVLALPFVFMAPDTFEVIFHRTPAAVSNVAQASNDVLGNASVCFFMLMLAVTPLAAMTGWRWHRVLRRDFGRAVFVSSAFDLALAATTENHRITGGLLARTVGHGFVFTGTLAVLIMLPLVVTSNGRAERTMGRHWVGLHRLVYLVWLLILVHLLFLFGLRSFFFNAVEVSVPLAVMHVGRVLRWWRRARAGLPGTILTTTGVAVAACIARIVFVAAFLAALFPFAHALIVTGVGALHQAPGG